MFARVSDGRERRFLLREAQERAIFMFPGAIRQTVRRFSGASRPSRRKASSAPFRTDGR
jgi:hypothetical protein